VPYVSQAHCPPTELFGKPPLWPGPAGDATTARLLWNETALYICYECEGQTATPIDPATVELDPKFAADMPEAVRSVLLDERVEAFIWPEEVQTSAGTPKDDQTYYAFECNYGGLALTNKAKFGSRMDFSWGAHACATPPLWPSLLLSAPAVTVPGHSLRLHPEVESLQLLTCSYVCL
jgi:hypothetical protein